MTLLESKNALLVLRCHQAGKEDGLLYVFNLSSREVTTQLLQMRHFQDLTSEEKIDGSQPLTLAAWQFM